MKLKIDGSYVNGTDIGHPDGKDISHACCWGRFPRGFIAGNTLEERKHYARLMVAAPEMYESLRDAVLFMQFLGKRERPLSAEEQEWLKKAVLLLDKIEGGGE